MSKFRKTTFFKLKTWIVNERAELTLVVLETKAY